MHKVHYLPPLIFQPFFNFLRDVSMNMKGKKNAIFLLPFSLRSRANFIFLKIAFTFHFPSFFVHSLTDTRAGEGVEGRWRTLKKKEKQGENKKQIAIFRTHTKKKMKNAREAKIFARLWDNELGEAG